MLASKMGRITNPSFAIRLVYAVCLAGATYNHATIVAIHGIGWDYGGLPAFVCAYWTSLTLIDALAAVLLLTAPRPGLALTAAIIVSDVAINAWVGLAYGFDVPAFLAQVLFLLFVMATVRIAWRLEPAAGRRHQPTQRR